MKTIAVYFTPPGYLDPPLDNADYVTSYQEFARTLVKKGGELWLARGAQTFLGGNRFSRGWRFDGEAFRETAKAFQADLVFNKGEDFAPDAQTNVINRPELDDICRKDRTFELFPDLSPFTIVVRSEEKFRSAVARIPSPIVVVKPPHLGAGKGVIIGPKEQILALTDMEYPLLVQEEIDMSGGIPGLIAGAHDFRCLFVGGEIVLTYIRTPPPGKRIANVAQGGSLHIFDRVEDSPKEPLAIARQIDSRLTHIPTRVYTADFGRSRSGEWKLIELNSPPGLFAANGNAPTIRYHERLADHLLAHAS